VAALEIGGDAAEAVQQAVKSRSTKLRSKKAMSLSPLMRPPRRPMSIRPTTSCQPRVSTQLPSFSRSPAAATAPTKAPMEQPLMICGSMPSRASARNTPICAQPGGHADRPGGRVSPDRA
jgi:hypothetical protein